MSTFIEQCLKGDAHPSDVDDWVDAWHEGGHSGTLADHLGMTGDEYARWVENPQFLRQILVGREQVVPLDETIGAGSANRPSVSTLKPPPRPGSRS